MTYVTYSRTGPFVDNGSPPIDHVFLNAVETFLAAGWFDSLIISDGSGHLTLANNTAYRAKDSGGTARDVLWIDGSNQTNLTGITGTDITYFKTSGGTAIASVTAAGLNLLSGTLSLLTGSVARIAKFTGTATTTSTFFNHGLSVIPDVVIVVLNGVSSTAHSITVDYSTMTTTQVKLTGDASLTFVGLAIKF